MTHAELWDRWRDIDEDPSLENAAAVFVDALSLITDSLSALQDAEEKLAELEAEITQLRDNAAAEDLAT